ncbi:MAG TPA: GTPase Era [bacterium]|nr:GTPase Era [bacterium]
MVRRTRAPGPRALEPGASGPRAAGPPAPKQRPPRHARPAARAHTVSTPSPGALAHQAPDAQVPQSKSPGRKGARRNAKGAATGPFRSGFVCLLGRPNVGKSTLVNRLVGQAISITSPKPQTTRHRILGVCHGPGWQVVLVDTPGVHLARDALNQRMVRYALRALEDTDLVLLLVEPLAAGAPPRPAEDERVLQALAQAGRPAWLVINKADLATEADLAATRERYQARYPFGRVLSLSARTGQGVDALLAALPGALPEGPHYFEAGQVTDLAAPTLLAELVRQEVFRRTQQEVPYSTAARVELLEQRGGHWHVHCRVFVERDSQKGILIGKGGQMLKAIGQAARPRMEWLLGGPVYLDLQVTVLPGWSRDARLLEELGYPEE